MEIQVEDDMRDLWGKWGKTNPENTKQVRRGGRTITTIDCYSQIETVTKELGLMGNYGLRNVALQFAGELVFLTGEFFHPGGAFSVINSASMYMGRDEKKRLDDEVGKKIMTDTLTKAFSYIGVNNDVFKGLFDNQRYINERTKEVAEDLHKQATDELEDCVSRKAINETQRDGLQKRLDEAAAANDIDALTRGLKHIQGIG